VTFLSPSLSPRDFENSFFIKEKLDGNFDLSKGSYYANPQYDRPVENEALIAEYSSSSHPNIWPTEDLPELEQAFKDLGRLMVAVGTLVAAQCDSYVQQQCPSYNQRLKKTIETSLCCKARLLHYFDCSQNVIQESEGTDMRDPFSSWCGWHNDHGSLTGLVSAMFIDSEGYVVANSDPTAGDLIFVIFSVLLGLYCRNRKSHLVKVSIPENHLAFQIGETAQVHTGGILQVKFHGSSALLYFGIGNPSCRSGE
jgi:isopenicillin N synthase-like dioxygenase